MAYVKPQVLVYQEFTQVAAAITDPLRACIVGPHFHLQRYDDASEKASGSLGSYSPDVASAAYSWPGRPSGAAVDTGYTRLFIDNAYLRFFADSTIRSQIVSASKVRHPTKNLVSYTNPVTGITYARHASLLRDVKIGDIVRVYGSTLGAAAEEAYSSIIGFVHDMVASAIGTPSFAASNAVTTADTSGSATVTAVISSANHVVTNHTGDSGYNGASSGDITETYTITVTQGGAPGVATISVTSASGRDDVASTVITAFGTNVAIGTRGVVVRFASATSAPFVLGDKWTITVSAVYTKLSTANVIASTTDSSDPYSGVQNTTYILTVTRGGDSAGATPPQVTVSTVDGYDSSGPVTIDSDATFFNMGNYNLKVKFTSALAVAGGLAKGDKVYIAVTAKANGPVRTMVLANNLPAAMVPSSGGSGSYYYEDVNLELFIKKNIEVDKCDSVTGVTNFTQSATQITVNGSIVGYDGSWASAGVPVGLPVRRGTVYVTYRALKTTYATSVFSLSTVSEVEDTLGPAVPDNPLALGVYKALQNANGTPVKYVAVPTNDQAGYSDALELLVGRRDVYGIVPLSHDRAIQDLVAAHAANMSGPDVGRWRVAWLGASQATSEQLLSTSGTIADDPDTTGTQYTYVQASGANFLTKGVLPGDTIRTSFLNDLCGGQTYSEYEIDAVINEDTVRLVAGPASAIAVAQTMQVWRALDKEQQAQGLATLAGSFGSSRVRVVWPNLAKSSGVEMESFYVAAALAGLRSGVVPHQGLTNVEVAGFDDVRVDYFNSEQLNTMATSGVWVVTQDPNTGQIFTRHQVTTGDTDIVTQREDSVVSNLDSISYYFLDSLAPYIGVANVTPTTLALVRTQVMSGISFLKANGFTESLGGQIIDATIVELKAHDTLKDRLKIRLELEMPIPINNIELTLVV